MRTLALVCVIGGTGCASIFTGTRQDLSFSSQPTASTVVLSGLPADVLLKAQQVSDTKAVVVALLAPALPPEARQFLDALTPEELLTLVFLSLDPTAEVARAAAAVGTVYAQAPAVLRQVIQRYLPVAAAGTTPFSTELKKGQEYAVLSWSPGRRVRLLGVDTHFNWVSLLNVFNLGLGFVIDVLTGAWLNLHPTELKWDLPPAAPLQ